MFFLIHQLALSKDNHGNFGEILASVKRFMKWNWQAWSPYVRVYYDSVIQF